MKYIKLNLSPNRKVRRALNAIARREPTKENFDALEDAQKAGINKPYVKPVKEAA